VLAKVFHALNILLDLFGIVKSLLQDSFLLDLFEDPQLRHYLRVHALKVSRLCNSSRPLALLASALVLCHGDFLLQVIGPDTVQCYQSDLVEHVEVVQVALMKDKLQQEGWRVHID